MDKKPGTKFGGLEHLSLFESYPPLIRVLKKNSRDSTPIYQNDVVRLVPDKTIVSGGIPGTSLYTGVAMHGAPALTESRIHVVIAGPSATFAAQDNGVDLERLDRGLYVNFDFQPGNDEYGISGHCLDGSTQAENSSLDAKLVQLVPIEGWNRIIVRFNRRYYPINSGGRPKGTGSITEFNKREVLDFVIKIGREILSEYDEVSKHNVAARCGGRYGISAQSNRCDKCAGCQAIDRLIRECNPSWNWRDDILPRIKESYS